MVKIIDRYSTRTIITINKPHLVSNIDNNNLKMFEH